MTIAKREMIENVYYRLLKKYGSIPKCFNCNVDINIGDNYIVIAGRVYLNKRYCLKCAKEKNIIPKKVK